MPLCRENATDSCADSGFVDTLVDHFSEEAKKYIERVLELPPIKEWIAEAIRENTRERLHEEEAIGGRKVLRDLRDEA